MDLSDIQKQLDKIMFERNNSPIPEFEGYSPNEMHQILHFTFGPKSPIQLQKLSDDEYRKIPILNQIKYLADVISRKGELKLTTKGFLPVKVVSDLYGQGYLTDYPIEKGIVKLYKEKDSMTVHLTRLLVELSGIVKKRNGKMSLTKNGEKLVSDNDKLLRTLFEVFGTKLNWAYFDGYGDNSIGQLGYGFTLILLSKYGNKEHRDFFYAGKYFEAFPRLMNFVEPSFGSLEENAAKCYSLRTFNRFLDYFGLIKIKKEGHWFDNVQYISKSDLFDKLVQCLPHKISGKSNN